MIWKQTLLSSAAPHAAGSPAATKVGRFAPQSTARVVTRRLNVTVVVDAAANVKLTAAVPVALRSLATAPGWSLASQAERRQLGAVPVAPPCGAKALVGFWAVQPDGGVPASGLS